jgi:hypothetical protein
VERLGGEPHTRLRYFCSPHYQDSALYPSIAQLERVAGFRREDTAKQRLAKLEGVLAQGTNDLSEAVPLLAELLSIPMGDRYPPLNLTPQKRKERTLHAQLAQVEGLAARQPVLMVFEDIHWSDPTTRESLDLLVDRIATLRVLVILTFRPEFSPPWLGRPHVTMVTLNRLTPRQRAEMIVHLTGGKALRREIADQIVERTDGVPLFIEELTKSVVESGIVTEAGDHFAVAGPSRAIPASLHASLLARLDRLAPTREVAQIGSALGRSFSHELISAVAGMPQQKLDDALVQLVAAEVIFRRGTPPNTASSTRWCRMPLTAYCCAAGANSYMPELPARWRASSARSRPPNLNSWRSTLQKPASSRRLLAIGSRPASSRSRVQPWRKRSRNCKRDWKYSPGWRIALGVRIERVMTDNGSCYRSKMFRAACKRSGPAHPSRYQKARADRLCGPPHHWAISRCSQPLPRYRLGVRSCLHR